MLAAAAAVVVVVVVIVVVVVPLDWAKIYIFRSFLCGDISLAAVRTISEGGVNGSSYE